MKKERDEVWMIINTDKYKNFKDAEGNQNKFNDQLDKVREQMREVQDKYSQEQGVN